MSLRSVMVQLSEEQITVLDREAQRGGVSRSHLVRQAVDALVAPPIALSVDAQYAAAYPTPESGADDWGDLDSWHDAARSDRVGRERDPW